MPDGVGDMDGTGDTDGTDDSGDGTGGTDGTDDSGDGTGQTVSVGLADLSGEVTRFGTVSIEQPGEGVFAEDGGISAGFLQFGRAFPAVDAVENYRPAPDTCTVETYTADTSPDDFDFSFDSLSAGEQLLLSAGGTSYVEIPRQQAFGFTLYQLDSESLPGPLPDDLVLDIPGDAYPAFSGVAVPNVAPLTGVTPDTSAASGFGGPSAVTADTVFGWDAGTEPDVYVVISASATDFGEGGIEFTDVECLAIDDGEFAFPAETRAALGTTLASATVTVTRVGLTILRRGSTLLFVSNQSGG